MQKSGAPKSLRGGFLLFILRYRGNNNKNPPLKDFRAPNFHTGSYYSTFFWPKFPSAFIILKKKSPAACVYYFIFLRGQIWAPRRSIFRQNSRFCLKNTLKKFRLRRAGRSGVYYSQKISACGGLLLFFFFLNLVAFIILLFSSQNFLLLLLFYF